MTQTLRKVNPKHPKPFLFLSEDLVKLVSVRDQAVIFLNLTGVEATLAHSSATATASVSVKNIRLSYWPLMLAEIP